MLNYDRRPPATGSWRKWDVKLRIECRMRLWPDLELFLAQPELPGKFSPHAGVWRHHMDPRKKKIVVPAVPTKKNTAVSDIIRGSQGAPCVIRTFSILEEFSLKLGTWH